jgi:hypothetical protein
LDLAIANAALLNVKVLELIKWRMYNHKFFQRNHQSSSSKEEPPPILVHARLVLKHLFPTRQLKRPFLQAHQFQRKPWPKFLQIRPLPVFKDIPVPSEKDEIPLIVKRSNLSAFELWLVRH